MTPEQVVLEALKLADEQPTPLEWASLIACPQSFAPLFYHLIKLLKPRRIFEWGPGQSTNVFLRSDDTVKIDSYEQVQHWADKYYNEIVEKNPAWKDRINFTIKPEGTPLAVTDFPDETFDFILVDGRDRANCMKEAERIAKTGAVVACHDTQRETYMTSINAIISDRMKHVCRHFPGQEATDVWVKL